MLGFAVQLRLWWGVAALASWIIVVKMGDIGAYTVGRLIGRHKMAPLISPGKTMEGAVGALAFSCFGSWLTFHWLVGILPTTQLAQQFAQASLSGPVVGLDRLRIAGRNGRHGGRFVRVDAETGRRPKRFQRLAAGVRRGAGYPRFPAAFGPRGVVLLGFRPGRPLNAPPLLRGCISPKRRSGCYAQVAAMHYDYWVEVFRSSTNSSGGVMSIRCVCPNGHPLTVSDSLAGKSGLCPLCRAPVRVPQKASAGRFGGSNSRHARAASAAGQSVGRVGVRTRRSRTSVRLPRTCGAKEKLFSLQSRKSPPAPTSVPIATPTSPACTTSSTLWNQPYRSLVPRRC